MAECLAGRHFSRLLSAMLRTRLEFSFAAASALVSRECGWLTGAVACAKLVHADKEVKPGLGYTGMTALAYAALGGNGLGRTV